MDPILLAHYASEIREAIDLFSTGIDALPTSTPTGAGELAIFARLASRETGVGWKQLGGALELVWVDVDSIATEDVVLGEFGMPAVLAVFKQIGEDALAEEGPKEARRVLSWLEALARAVVRQISAQSARRETAPEPDPSEKLLSGGDTGSPFFAPSPASSAESAGFAPSGERNATPGPSGFANNHDPAFLSTQQPKHSSSAIRRPPSPSPTLSFDSDSADECATPPLPRPKRIIKESYKKRLASDTQTPLTRPPPLKRKRKASVGSLSASDVVLPTSTKSKKAPPMSPAVLESKAKAFHAVRPSADLVDRQFRRQWRFAVGTCVLAWFPDQGWWPSVIVAPSPRSWWAPLIAGERNAASYIVKSIPQGGDWRWALPTDIRELPHKCPPPTHWRLGNKVSTNDAKLWKSAVQAATFRPAELKAWLELSTHYEDGLQKNVTAAGKAAAKRASTAK